MSAWKVAFIRGLGSAVVTGAMGFLAVWSTTDSAKTLVIAGMVPFLSTLSIRFALEGAIDSRKAP